MKSLQAACLMTFGSIGLLVNYTVALHSNNGFFWGIGGGLWAICFYALAFREIKS